MCVLFIQKAAVDKVISPFRSICGKDNVSLGEAIREQHGKDESVHRSEVLCLLHLKSTAVKIK